jgi:hypothetical protein
VLFPARSTKSRAHVRGLNLLSGLPRTYVLGYCLSPLAGFLLLATEESRRRSFLRAKGHLLVGFAFVVAADLDGHLPVKPLQKLE